MRYFFETNKMRIGRVVNKIKRLFLKKKRVEYTLGGDSGQFKVTDLEQFMNLNIGCHCPYHPINLFGCPTRSSRYLKNVLLLPFCQTSRGFPFIYLWQSTSRSWTRYIGQSRARVDGYRDLENSFAISLLIN